MDERVRGMIESEFDSLMKSNILDSIKWLTQEVPHSSTRDIALGYVVGAMATYGMALHGIALKQSIKADELRSVIRRRLPEIREKINRELHR
ncbi:MAG: hypothetical protein JSV57_03060 [Candidatus Bathyarchaeota archaeon]|nr:MAG: hypothetical protein JSV57_03060 [Candidatus Bathyarchaeota archaeon]